MSVLDHRGNQMGRESFLIENNGSLLQMTLQTSKSRTERTYYSELHKLSEVRSTSHASNSAAKVPWLLLEEIFEIAIKHFFKIVRAQTQMSGRTIKTSSHILMLVFNKIIFWYLTLFQRNTEINCYLDL